jgi:hypothetical protein
MIKYSEDDFKYINDKICNLEINDNLDCFWANCNNCVYVKNYLEQHLEYLKDKK